MTTRQRSTVVGVFHDRHEADLAVAELRKVGFRDDQIGVASRDSEAKAKGSTGTEHGSHVGTGAAVGALAGAGVGGLVGLGVISGVIPVLGPVIAGGTLAAILANAAGGAAIGGMLGALTGAGIPEEEARYYESEFESGRTIVTIKADNRYDEAVGILRRFGAYDMHSAGTTSSASAGSRSAASSTGVAYDVPSARASTHGQGTQKMQLREEELHARKTPVEAGEVRVHKEVVTEHKTLEVPVQREEVVIERHTPQGRTTSTTDLKPGEEIRVPVMEEQVSVDKQAVVKEEVTVGKRKVSDTEKVSADVRKEQARVERKGDVDVRACETDMSKKSS